MLARRCVALFGSMAFAMSMVSCNLFSNNNNSNVVSIPIKGTIASGAAKLSNIQFDSVTSLAKARSVLVCQGFSYSLANIVNGSFTAYAPMGKATALVFLDSNNQYIGNLCAGGLNMLPLSNLKDGGNTVIDLTTLTLSGTSVVPAHNPLGDEILVSESEIAMMKELGSFYESLAKNIDADNNGVPDILSNRQLMLNTHFNINNGTYGINSVAPMPADSANISINYRVRISGNGPLIPPDSIVAMSGPLGDPYDDITFERYAQLDGFIAFFLRQGGLPFKKGTYTITLKGTNNYSLNYSNINAKFYLVTPTPTLHTNSAGMLVLISVAYTLPDGSFVDPTSFITNLQFQLHTSTGGMSYGGMYEGIPTSSTITNFNNYILPTPIDISSLVSVSVNYNDLLGNEYDTFWHK